MTAGTEHTTESTSESRQVCGATWAWLPTPSYSVCEAVPGDRV